MRVLRESLVTMLAAHTQSVVSPPSPDVVAAVPPARPGAKRWVKWGVRYAIAAAILWWLFTQFEFAQVLAALRQADWRWLGAAGLASVALQVIIAIRLRRLIMAQGIDLSTRELFEINLATMFYGLFLPGGNFAGLAVRLFRLGKEGGDLTGAGVALFIDRIVATISLCLVGMAFWLLERPDDTWPIFAVMAGATAAMVLMCVAITARWPLPGPLRKWGGKLQAAMQKWRTMSRRDHVQVLLLGVASHVVGIVVFVCLAWSLNVSVGFISLGWIRSAVILATMIPISVGGLGLREGAMVVMLQAYAVSEPDALAMSLLVFATVLLLPGLLGAVYEARRLFTR